MDAEPVGTLHLCTACGGGMSPAAAEGLVRDALANMGIPLAVAGSACMGPCETPLAVALQGQGRAAYVFAGIVLPGDLDDIVATCRAWLDSPAGWIDDARPCGRLRFCLRTRVPAP